jgi:hypothetical protein
MSSTSPHDSQDVPARGDPLTVLVAPVKCAAKHRIAVQFGGKQVSMFQIQFGKEGLFVHFPYHPNATGIACLAEFPPSEARHAVVDFTNGGYVTSHKVRYSHHTDGETHFSQDRKVLTVVRNQGRPLTSAPTWSSHIFTVYASGLERFATPKQGVAPAFRSEVNEHVTVRIVGLWSPFTVSSKEVNPVRLERSGPTTEVLTGYACSPPAALETGTLVLPAFGQPHLGGSTSLADEFRLLFLGGFSQSVNDRTQRASALFLSYPVTDLPDVPSMDFRSL